MSYKALFTADWQLSNSLPHAKAVDLGETDRLHDQLKVIRTIGEIAEREKVHGIYVLGDIFDKRLLDAITLKRGVEVIYALAKAAPIYLLAGNHDAHSARGARFLPEVFDETKNKAVRYLDGSDFIVPTGSVLIRICAMPWSPVSEAGQALVDRRKMRGDDTVNVLLLHHNISGCSDGGWVCDDGLDAGEVCDGWDLVLAGHFHERQSFGSCGEYVGAPMQHDFGDAGSADRGVRIIEFSKDKIRKSFKKIVSPKFHIGEWGDPDWSDVCEKGDYLRVDVRAAHPEYKTLLPEVMEAVKEWRANGLNVLEPKHIPIQQHEDRFGFEEAPSDEAAVKKFVELANTDGLDEQRLIEMGLGIIQEVRGG